MPQSRQHLSSKPVPRTSFMRRRPRQPDSGNVTPSPEILALQQRIAEAVERQHQLCAAKQACEAELNLLMKGRRNDADDVALTERYGDKLEEMRGLAADAENAATEIGRASGDLLIFQLRNGPQSRKT